MKKTLLMLAMFLTAGFMNPVRAEVRTVEQGMITVAEDEVIDDDLFIAGETVEIEGTINGDVYVGGGSVRFSGRTTGDLIIAGGEVRVSGQVGDDLMIGAGNVNLIGAEITDSVRVGAGSVTIDKESSIGGSLLAATGMLDNEAAIGRNLLAGAGQVRVNAPVGKEMRVGAERVELGKMTKVGEDLVYMSEADLVLAEGATIAGETRKIEGNYPTKAEREEWKQKSAGAWVGAQAGMNIFSYLGALVVSLVMIWLLRKPTLKVAEAIKDNFLSALGWGLLVIVLAFPALIMLMVTGIGIPLALTLFTLLMLDFYLAKIFTSLAVGLVMQKQFAWTKLHLGWVMVIGLTVYYLLRMIPVLGMFVRMLAFVAGVGGVMLTLKKAKK